VPTSLGDLIKKARLEANLSLTDVARLTDMPTGQLSMIETGVRPNPSFFTIVKLARGLKISLDALASQCALDDAGEIKSGVEAGEHERLVVLREIEAAINGNEKIAARLRTLLENALVSGKTKRNPSRPGGAKKKRA
jgi:transcriptional regulator with XRE-family HTH domain